MRTRQILLAQLCAFFFTLSSNAQNCDPWIAKAYNQLYGRNPSAAECNIKNYNNGSWNSYCQLVGFIAGYNKTRPGNFPKGDPWIFQAYCELYSKAPNAWELNVQNYNGGSWANYDELKKYIQQYHSSLSSNGIQTKTGELNGNTAVVFTDNSSKVIAVDLVSKDGGQVIAAGGGNVIAAGGGNVIAAGGGNVMITANTAGVSFGSDRTIQSVGSKVIPTAGKTKLVIR